MMCATVSGARGCAAARSVGAAPSVGGGISAMVCAMVSGAGGCAAALRRAMVDVFRAMVCAMVSGAGGCAACALASRHQAGLPGSAGSAPSDGCGY